MKYDYGTLGETVGGGEALITYRDELKRKISGGDLTIPEAGLAAVFSDAGLRKATEIHEKLGNVRHVFLIGIGGSSLGTEALYTALGSQVSLTVWDSLEEVSSGEVTDLLTAHNLTAADCAILIISKSGTTTETITNAATILSACESVWGEEETSARVVVISEEGSPLKRVSEEEGYTFCEHPHAVGGRFSVFSVVGLLPLTLLGYDVAAFLSGAQEKLAEEFEGKDAIVSALLSIEKEKGGNTLDTFVFGDELSVYAKWYRQLYSESIGKDGHGMVATISTPEDLHSVAQLYQSEGRKIYTQFHTILGGNEAQVPEEEILEALPYLSGKTYAQIGSALRDSVLSQYTKLGLSYTEFVLSRVSLEELGALMAFRMLETLYIAHALGVDPFTQANVEGYKDTLRTLLDS